MLTIYKASAGSGKTFQLARTYIKHILGYQDKKDGAWKLYPAINDEHRHILAVTFTNKATAEMKKRIINELSILSNPETVAHSDYIKYFTSIFNTSTAEIQKQAHLVLNNILFNYRLFNISTIDSFFQTVLRTFSHELDLNSNYNIELDDEEIIAFAVEDLLNTVNGNSFILSTKPTPKERAIVSKWLELYMKNQMLDGKSFNIFNKNGYIREVLIKFIGKMMNERFRQNSQQILEWCLDVNKTVTFKNDCQEKHKITRNKIRQNAIELTKYINELQRETNTKILKQNGLKSILNSCADTSMTTPKINFKSTFFQNALKGDSKNCFHAGYSKIYPDSPLFTATIDYCIQLKSDYQDLKLMDVLKQNIYPLGIFSEVLKRIENYTKSNGIFLLSDTNEFLHKIIDKEDSPFIYERIGYTLKHFLLDEFQDTSRMQWENLRPLLIQSLSIQEDNLIIGDEKQCIYRFRNSDPSIINNEAKSNLQYLGEIEEKGNILEDNTNWRSAPLIVKFNNTLFTKLSKDLQIEGYYTNTIQKAAEKNSEMSGYIDISFLTNKTDNDTNDQSYSFSFKSISNDPDLTLDEKIAFNRMCLHIERQLNSQYIPSDIAVLCRKNKEGDKIIRCLLSVFDEMKVPKKPEVVSGDALTLGESPTVRSIVSKLRIMSLPDNDKINESKWHDYYDNKKRIQLLFTRFNIFLSTFLNNGDLNANPLESALKDISIDATIYNGLKNDANIDSNLNLYTLTVKFLYEYLLESGLNEKEFKAKNENIYIATLLDKIIEFESIKGSDLIGFLEWWDNEGSETAVHLPANSNAITVITIHKSKGLEYDCVHIPLLNYKIYLPLSNPNPTYYWFDTKNLANHFDSHIPPFIPLPVKTNLAELEPFEVQFNELLNDYKLDILNLVYVAFTRAARELIITTQGNVSSTTESETSTANIVPFLFKALSCCNETESLLSESITDRKEKLNFLIPLTQYLDNNNFVLGLPTAKILKDKDKRNDNSSLKAIKENMVIEIINNTPIKSLDEVTRPLIVQELSWNDSAQRGTFFHEVLQYIKTWEDLDYALNLVTYKYGMSKKDYAIARKLLQKSYDALQYKRWFNGYDFLLNEIPVYQFNDNEQKQKRPDRVVFYDNNKIDIIDYKFATPDLEAHSGQVKEYMEFFKKSGYTNVFGYIWYPQLEKVEPVKF